MHHLKRCLWCEKAAKRFVVLSFRIHRLEFSGHAKKCGFNNWSQSKSLRIVPVQNLINIPLQFFLQKYYSKAVSRWHHNTLFYYSVILIPSYSLVLYCRLVSLSTWWVILFFADKLFCWQADGPAYSLLTLLQSVYQSNCLLYSFLWLTFYVMGRTWFWTKISLVGALGLETILVPKWDQDQVFVAFVAK